MPLRRQDWRVAAHAPDNSLFHVMAEEGFAHAIYKIGAAEWRGARNLRHGISAKPPSARQAVLTPPQERPFGFVVRDFGNRKGGAGFVLYRVTGGSHRAVAGGGAGRRCRLGQAAGGRGGAVHALRFAGRAQACRRAIRPCWRRASPLRCIQGQCGETDFAATYLTVLRLGYVHNLKGEMFLVRPAARLIGRTAPKGRASITRSAAKMRSWCRGESIEQKSQMDFWRRGGACLRCCQCRFLSRPSRHDARDHRRRPFGARQGDRR